jgi:hypothetical protein
MADNEQHRAKLQELNRNYIRSVDEADVAWFDANLASDFFNTNPDGSFIDRKAFLAQIGRGSSVRNIREHDVLSAFLATSPSSTRAPATRSPTAPKAPAATPTIGSFAMGAGNASPRTSRDSRRRDACAARTARGRMVTLHEASR